MDISKIEGIVSKLKDDKDLQAKFKSDPTAVVKDLVGVDLPEDQIKQVIEAIKAKLGEGGLGGILGSLGGILGKK